MSLADAIIYGNKEIVLQLLEAGADINEIDEYGFRPLIEAAITGKTDIAGLLLDYGAAVDQEDATGRTALHWAIENKNIELCSLLLKKGANPNSYTNAGQPLLIYPILRKQTVLKNLLYDAGADLNFALDYINAKLLGHRFALLGKIDIVEPRGRFIELDLEGFFLEFTLDIILHSLQRYRNNFAAKHLRPYFGYIRKLIDAFSISAELIRFQHYTIKIENYAQRINQLLDNDLLIIPVAHRGHAITFIKFGSLFAKCDRGANSSKEGSINIYRVHNQKMLNREFFKQLIYVRQAVGFMDVGYKELLGVEHLMQIPLASQITGNCSWANVEAAIPVILFLLLVQTSNNTAEAIRDCMNKALAFYKQWQEWDKDRALYDCIQSFQNASPARKASKAALLGAVLFQCCQYTKVNDIERAEKILKILTTQEYRYVLESYLDIYWRRTRTLPGENLVHMLDLCGVSIHQ